MLIKRVFLASLFIPLIISCSSESQDVEAVTPSVTSVEVADTPIRSVNIDYSHVAYQITEQDYPGTYAKWGKKWIDDINSMMPLVVERIASNPKCDAPEIADLSDNRSSLKQEAVFYVDCKNGERFYVSQNELSEVTKIKAESEMLSGEPSQYIQPCREMIKPQLSYPSTFDESLGGVSAFKGTSGNIVVEIDFTAKNAIGTELPQSARCVFGTNGENEAIITNK